jgi:hypothetical protein
LARGRTAARGHSEERGSYHASVDFEAQKSTLVNELRRTSLNLLALALASSLTGCGDDENPITSGSSVGRLRGTAAIVFTSDSYTTRPGAPREMFAIDEDGSGLTRVTNCNTDSKRCDHSEVAPAPDGRRFALRRATTDTNMDGRVGPGDNEVVVIIDTQRGTEGQIELRASTPGGGFVQTNKLSGLDWSPLDDLLVYAGNGEGGNDDMFRTIPRPDLDASQTRNLTFTSQVRERRPRIDPTGTAAVYERTEATSKSQVYLFGANGTQSQVTTAGPGDETLGSYTVGGDADPDYSPDGRSLVFRRLSATGNGGLGVWDLMTIRIDRTGLGTVVSGPVYRSAPDWGPKGLVFSEIDKATGLAQLVILQPDGSGRRVIATLNGFDIASPRWIPKP